MHFHELLFKKNYNFTIAFRSFYHTYFNILLMLDPYILPILLPWFIYFLVKLWFTDHLNSIIITLEPKILSPPSIRILIFLIWEATPVGSNLPIFEHPFKCSKWSRLIGYCKKLNLNFLEDWNCILKWFSFFLLKSPYDVNIRKYAATTSFLLDSG